MSLNKILVEDIESVIDGAQSSLKLLSGKKVLVTGGGGFLGYLMCNVLAQYGQFTGNDNIELTIFDNFSRKNIDWISSLKKLHNVKVFKKDVTNDFMSSEMNFDYIIHAASIASPTFYRKFPIETIDANVNGIRAILDYAKSKLNEGSPVCGILYFSTSEIYGDPDPGNIPTNEDYRGNVSCTGPRACYDESKRLGETLCVNFAKKYGLDVKIVRPFNNYGPGLDLNDNRLMPDIVRDIMANKNIKLFSDGNATRTFCYISDAVVGYLKVLTHGRGGESYNIGIDAPEISVINFAERIIKHSNFLWGYKGKLSFESSNDLEYLTDNPSRRCPDITRARNELSYKPKVDLDSGIIRSLEWYKDIYQ